MPDRFVYSTPKTRVVFGNGTVRELPAEAQRAGMSRILVLCSKGRTQLAESIVASLGAASAGICAEAVPNMPREAFDAVKEQLAQRQADGFVAVGGGSAFGLAKAVAVAANAVHGRGDDAVGPRCHRNGRWVAGSAVPAVMTKGFCRPSRSTIPN